VSVSDADMFRAAAPSQQRPSAATLRKVLPRCWQATRSSDAHCPALACRSALSFGLCLAVLAPASMKRPGNRGRTHCFVLNKLSADADVLS
jgi:hypothetical protein